MNNFRHGLAGGRFYFLSEENPEHYDQLQQVLTDEHQPQTATEHLLVEKMARSQWLAQRAIDIHTMFAANVNVYSEVDDLTKWVRYQMQHERAFEKALNQ